MAKKETASASVRIEKPATTRARTAKHSKAIVSAAPVPAAAAAHDIYEREAIAQLAYLYAEERGFQGGSPESDWLRAETEFRARTTLAASA